MNTNNIENCLHRTNKTVFKKLSKRPTESVVLIETKNVVNATTSEHLKTGVALQTRTDLLLKKKTMADLLLAVALHQILREESHLLVAVHLLDHQHVVLLADPLVVLRSVVLLFDDRQLVGRLLGDLLLGELLLDDLRFVDLL